MLVLFKDITGYTGCSPAVSVTGTVPDQVEGVVGDIRPAQEGGSTVLEALVVTAGQGVVAEGRSETGEIIQTQTYGTIPRFHKAVKVRVPKIDDIDDI